MASQPTSSGEIPKSPHEALRDDLLKLRRQKSPVTATIVTGHLPPTSLERRLSDQTSPVRNPASQPRSPKRQNHGPTLQSGIKSGYSAVNIKAMMKKRDGNDDSKKSKAVDRVQEKIKRLVNRNPKKGKIIAEKHAVQPKSVSKEPPRAPGVLSKMRARLQGGQFRMLNEALYTMRGEEAFGLFQKSPGAFRQYHEGYEEQTAKWPQVPLDAVINWLKTQPTDMVVADFGCGEAKLAASAPNRVVSLDLVAAHPDVIACNMAHTPLESTSVGCVVFCLSLMGVDYSAFITEAHRVINVNGWLLIAEVKSRLDPGNGGATPNDFIRAVTGLGFALRTHDTSNKMFMLFVFQKKKAGFKNPESIKWPTLKACVYKRR